MDGEGLCITILAGGRAELLRQTLEGLKPVLDLPGATVVSFLNQEDDASRELLWNSTEMLTLGQPGVTPIGVGYRALAQVAAQHRWWCHVEDDWGTVGSLTGTLERAQRLLEERSDVIQVRLRHHNERVMSRHMVTMQTIKWKAAGDHLLGHAHWTCNPSLVRGTTATWFAGGPVEGEQHVQRIVHKQAAKALVAQAVPGAFVHLGDDSLRRRSGRGADRHGLPR